jgi:hypothetical protein
MLDMAQPQDQTARECINGSDEEEMMEWQPIETAPKDGTVIIVYAPDFFQTAAWVGNGWTNAANSWLGDVTHWMPLPEPPK